MSTIVKRERKNWFYSYNMIFEQPISEHAKIVYLYLCRCADAEGQSFPSHNTIGKKCGIKSRQTIINALTELEKIGLLTKEKRIKSNGGQTSNAYIIYDSPHPPVQQMDTPCLGDRHPPVQQMDTPCLGDGHEGLSFKGLYSFKDYPVRESVPAPAPNTYGEFQNVKLTADEYNTLKELYQQDKTTDYINRLDRHMASKGGTYKSHYATIKKWIDEDEKKQSRPPEDKPQKKGGKFNNFKSRDIDFSEIERQERELLCKRLMGTN